MKRIVLTAAVCGALAVPAVAAAPKKVTPKGVGAIKLHATFKSVRSKRLVGPMQPGCELAGPSARGAQLKPPLRGGVELTTKAPRRIKSIIVSKGATARGVAIGATKAEIKAAFPKAKFDTSTQKVFQITLVKIPKDGGGPLQMALRNGKVDLFGVPYIAFCE